MANRTRPNAVPSRATSEGHGRAVLRRIVVTLVGAAVGMAVLVVSIAFLFGWFADVGSGTFAFDAAKQAVFEARSGAATGVRRLAWSVSGELEGTGTLVIDGQRTVELGPGVVDISEEHDFYAVACSFEYLPVGVTAGRLTVEYSFKRM